MNFWQLNWYPISIFFHCVEFIYISYGLYDRVKGNLSFTITPCDKLWHLAKYDMKDISENTPRPSKTFLTALLWLSYAEDFPAQNQMRKQIDWSSKSSLYHFIFDWIGCQRLCQSIGLLLHCFNQITKSNYLYQRKYAPLVDFSSYVLQT